MSVSLGLRIKTLRENANITQVELARTLNIGNTTLSQYESGVRVPSDEIKIRIAKFFNVSLDYLLLGADYHSSRKDAHSTINTVRIAGRDGSYTEKHLTDDQLQLLQMMIDQMPDFED